MVEISLFVGGCLLILVITWIELHQTRRKLRRAHQDIRQLAEKLVAQSRATICLVAQLKQLQAELSFSGLGQLELPGDEDGLPVTDHCQETLDE